MYILDTNHISALERRGAEASRLLERLSNIPLSLVKVTIISYEEQVRGWMSEIARSKLPERQVEQYRRLQAQLENYCNLSILPFDSEAALLFADLRSRYRRLSTPDLKIAAVVLANRATLLTRNDRDFGQIEGLISEDWTI